MTTEEVVGDGREETGADAPAGGAAVPEAWTVAAVDAPDANANEAVLNADVYAESNEVAEDMIAMSGIRLVRAVLELRERVHGG